MSGADAVESMLSEDGLHVTLSVKWPKSLPLRKYRVQLQKVLQSWANTIRGFQGDCTILNVSEDGIVVICLNPAPAQSELYRLRGRTLSDSNGTEITVLFVGLTQSDLETVIPDNSSMDAPPSFASETQDVDEKLGEQSRNTFTCDIPMLHFWYVNQAYKEEIKRIEKESGVKILAEAKLTFEADTKDGNPNYAFSEFINLVHKCSGESKGFTVPLTKVKPEQWKDTLSIIQRPENNLFLTVSSEEMTVCGSRRSQDAIRQSLNATRNTSTTAAESTQAPQDTPPPINEPLSNAGPTMRETSYSKQVDKSKTQLGVDFKESDISQGKVKASSEASAGNVSLMSHLYQESATSLLITTATSTTVGESTWGSQDTQLSIGTMIKDPLASSGLTMEENCWKLITTSFNKKVSKIKSKFGVDFKESVKSPGEVEVRACYKTPGGNASMESHAVRALLHLYQKVATSPRSAAQQHGATWLSEASSEGASGGGPSTETPTEEGATAGDHKDDKCPICIDTFTNKKQLKCKHEFCEECLAQSVQSLGPICPVCRCVFEGKMTWDDKCPICFKLFTNKKQLKCKHEFCEECLRLTIRRIGHLCPVCRCVFGTLHGVQPEGKMKCEKRSRSLPGFSGCGTIIITYKFSNGRQGSRHPNPGERYHGTTKTAYLPDNKEGNEVLMLLKEAFHQRVIFTIGTSETGEENQVTWNDIPHKTSTTGGPQSFGYPDPEYLSRVKEELKAKGIE